MTSDGNKITSVEVNELTRPNLNNFMKKCFLKENNTVESKLKTVHSYSIYPRYSKLTTNVGFVNIDIGQMGGTHWTCFFFKKKNTSFLFR